MSRIIPHICALLTAGLVVPAASGLAAQTLGMGRIPDGVRVDLLDEPYTIEGTTVNEILEGLRAGRWYSYRWRIEWTHHREPVRASSISGASSRDPNTCQTERLDILLRFTARYPRWEPRAEPDPELREAWKVFAREVEDHWSLHRDVAIETAREMIRRTRMLREPCPLIFREARSLVDRIIEERHEDNIAIDRDYRPVWPPRGFDFAEVEDVIGEGDVAVAAAADRAAGVANPGDGSANREPPPPPSLADDIYGAVRRDIGFRAVGLGIALMHGGEVRFLESFGRPGANSEEFLLPGALFPFPALSEMLLGWSVGTLEARGVVDPEAPISRYLSGLDDRLGQLTLAQLLHHRAGLDDASRPDPVDWRSALDALDDRALFTDPGMVVSYSRYSYPLALRVVETAAGRTLKEIVTEVFLEPMSMDSTVFDADRAVELGLPPDRARHQAFDFVGESVAVGGMPVIYTTLPELMRLFGSWLQGDVPGGPDRYPAEGRAFDRGLWLDRVGEHPRASRICIAAGHGVGVIGFPETMSAAAIYGVGGWPHASANFTLAAIDSELEIGDAIYRRGRLRGVAGFPGDGDPRCGLPEAPLAQMGEDEPPVRAGDRAGEYRNGDRALRLEEIDGALHYRNGPQTLPVVHYRGDLHFTLLQGLPGFPLRLTRDEAGRRYVVRGEKAYLHRDDAGG